MTRITISGSFNHFFSDFVDCYKMISSFEGCIILSPKGCEIRDDSTEFMLLKSDTGTSVGEIEQSHLNAIKNSDFLVVVNPKNYIGISTSMEIGFAFGSGIPIYFTKGIPKFLKKYIEGKTMFPNGLVIDNDKKRIGIDLSFVIGILLARGLVVRCREKSRDVMLRELLTVLVT